MGQPQQPVAAPPPITGAALCGKSGRPEGADITQGAVGDCYLVSTLGQFAERQPDVIRNAISYDARYQTFGVTLHDSAGRTRTVTVTQDDLQQDRTYGPQHVGGVNSPVYWSGTHPDGSRPPVWPTVMETAYAKLSASSLAAAAAADLQGIGHGGWPKDPIHALTGSSDTKVVSAADLANTGKTYELLNRAIEEGRPVLLATNPMKDTPTDGLVKGTYYGPSSRFNSGHAYTVEGVTKDEQGNVSLTLRNPWGTNNQPLQGVRSSDPIVHVGLKTILDNGHLENITLGPAAVQKQSASEAARDQAAPHRNVPRSGAPTPEDAKRYPWADLAAAGQEITRAERAEKAESAAQRSGRSQTL